jgi:putative aldouronate transport system substrate-binding protein
MYKNRIFFVLVVLIITAGMVWAGGGRQSTGSTASAPAGGELPVLEYWKTNNGFLPVEIGSATYNFQKKVTGISAWMPYVEWNGGVDFNRALNLRFAAGNPPNFCYVVNGIEAELIRNGALADLTDLLPVHAPNAMKFVPEEMWSIVKAGDPTGKGRIWWFPAFNDHVRQGGLIRQDWLDKLGLRMPRTQAEYVAVLRAFRDRDPNGNGLRDEIPTGGREGGRWMDHLFNMYGVASWEGNPVWDIYNGQLTYSAVTQNMKDALVFMRQLYQEGLMDNETFLNNQSAWTGKVISNRVGNFYHIPTQFENWAGNLFANTGVKPNWVAMPVIEVPGYEGKGFNTYQTTVMSAWGVSAKQDEAHLIATLKLIDALCNTDNWLELYYGVEGMHHKVENGRKVLLPEDKSRMELKLMASWENDNILDFWVELYESIKTEENAWLYDSAIKALHGIQQGRRHIAGDGLPGSVYQDYPDLRSHTLWQEYVSKIVIGTFDISKFDEFVQLWNSSGGAEVTRRAREWYAKK